MPYLNDVVKALLTALALAIGAWLVKSARSILTTLKKVDDALPSLLKVAEEMKPNGGSTLRDKVDKMSKQLVFNEGARRVVFDLFDEGAFYECDEDGMFLYVNRAWNTVTGLTPADALGEGWIAGVHPDDREKVTREWNDCIKQHREFNLAYNMISTEGEVTRVQSRTRILRDYAGNVIGFLGVNKKIS